MLKIVLDTNSLINAASDDYNYNNRIIDEILEGKIAAFANSSTLAENKLMARRKISDSRYLAKLQQLFEAIAPVETRNWLRVVEDYDDNKILESAVESGADYLISSDHHLLKLERYDNVRIVRPEQFWHEYEAESGSGWRAWISDFIK